MTSGLLDHEWIVKKLCAAVLQTPRPARHFSSEKESEGMYGPEQRGVGDLSTKLLQPFYKVSLELAFMDVRMLRHMDAPSS
jgi:hypothetical protein